MVRSIIKVRLKKVNSTTGGGSGYQIKKIEGAVSVVAGRTDLEVGNRLNKQEAEALADRYTVVVTE